MPCSRRRNPPLAHPRSAKARAPALARVQCGIDVLVAEGFRPLRGLKIGLVTNHTGMTQDGKSTIDVLFHAPDVKLVKLFSPEHGIRGEVDAAVPDGKDEATGLPIVSLYGKERKPRREDLARAGRPGLRYPGCRRAVLHVHHDARPGARGGRAIEEASLRARPAEPDRRACGFRAGAGR